MLLWMTDRHSLIWPELRAMGGKRGASSRGTLYALFSSSRFADRWAVVDLRKGALSGAAKLTFALEP